MEKTSQVSKSINSHIETYLDYYCGLSHAPGFAVLLKGQWGAGKTWFINKYLEKLRNNNQKCLYVSLYGITTFSEIEYAFFQQLHPVLSSKGMAITGKILKGLLKGMLKIDLNNDSRDEGTLSLQVPEINLPEYLKNTDKSIIIFDDLERCKIDTSNILGYVNYFVEYQELKVVIIANEDEILKINNNYIAIKEKLIGQTFDILPDFHNALKDFIDRSNNPGVQNFLAKNVELIQDLYSKAEYENLRNLKQIILDFERIFEVLPEKAKNKQELLQDLLKLLMAFSIEIKRGAMYPKDISKLQEEYVSGLSQQVSSRQARNSVTKDSSKEQSSLQRMLSRYTMLNLYDPFPSKTWWQTFFDRGILDTQELEQSVLNSRYFQDENTPNWVKLWHFFDLSDNEFDSLIQEVESEYSNRKFSEIGIIKHIFGMFLMFSNAGIYCKSKKKFSKIQNFILII